MKNKKGQALVEFIIILPVFVFMILAIIDIGKILHERNVMQTQLNDVVTMYKENKKYEELDKYVKKTDKNYKLEVKNENNEYIEFNIKKAPEISTPGLNLIFKKDIEVKRVIFYEEQ